MKTNLVHLLFLSSGFTVSLILVRIFYSDSITYGFLIWNIFLAAIPLFISSKLNDAIKKNFQWILLTGWLIFFPNALYIITDLVHLKERYPVPIWFDIILIISAALNGLFFAYISLCQVELFLRSKFDNKKTILILFLFLFLGSFGVYIGRFLRWNSWDIVMNPSGLAFEVLQHIINPFHHPRTWGMTIILTFFFSIFYFIIKKLPGLINKPCN
jgi:uncharacterized membrane protein